MTATSASQSSSRRRFGGRGDAGWYAGAVVVGAVLIVIAAINQPFNQNELKQMAPYDSNNLSKIASGTRQPPLDPWLGSLFQHLLGEGQLRQRLVPVLAGIGALVLVGLLLRRLGLGVAGAFALWVMATAPLLVRYSAYTRPYALPLFLMTLFVYATQRWLDVRSRGWLAVTAVAAVALPLSRVPEPTVFLIATAATLVWLAWRGRYTRSQAWPPAAIALAALVFVGYPLFRTLASEAEAVWDPSPAGVIDRFPSGVHEIVTGLLPLLASWLPWWPITVLIAVAALAIPDARRRLTGWWFFWPLLAAPLVFVLAYHFLNSYPLDVRPYRARWAMFFVPSGALTVGALAATVVEGLHLERRVRIGIGILLAAGLLGQLPAITRALVDNEAADFGQVAEVLTTDLPPDAIVLFDTASPLGRWHQPFTAKNRYMGDKPFVAHLSGLVNHVKTVPKQGPVYFLFLDSECAFSVICDEPPAPWSGKVSGWSVTERFDKFTLYEPTTPLFGREGVIEATRAFGASLGPDYGARETFAAAALLKLTGHPQEGEELIRQMYADASPDLARRIHAKAVDRGWNPFE